MAIDKINLSKLEEREKIIVRLSKIQHGLILAAGFGLLAGFAIAPGSARLIKSLKILSFLKNFNSSKMARARNNLLKKGILRRVEEQGKITIRLSEQGNRIFETLPKYLAVTHAKKRWDNKWRVVIFDIQEKYKRSRDKLRIKLKQLGLYRLQDSVWVYPHPLEDILVLLKSEFRLGSSTLYIIADQIEQDRHLKKFFAIEDK